MKGADEYTLTKNAKTRTSEDICGHIIPVRALASIR
jgi:hypothetical protein